MSRRPRTFLIYAPTYIIMLKLIRVFTLVLFLGQLSTLHAENYMKNIISRYVEDGTLFFIKPSRVNIKEGEVKKNLEFDVTYVSPQDSITLNASIQLLQPQRVDSLVCQSSAGEIYSFSTKRLYIQPRNSYWEVRLSIVIPYTQWKSLLNSEKPCCLLFTNNHRTIVSYQFTTKQWSRQQGIFKLLDQIRNS